MFQELLFWKTKSDVIEIEHTIDPPPVPAASDETAAEADEIGGDFAGDSERMDDGETVDKPESAGGTTAPSDELRLEQTEEGETEVAAIDDPTTVGEHDDLDELVALVNS